MRIASLAGLLCLLVVGLASAQTNVVVETTALPETVDVTVSPVVVEGQVAVRLVSGEPFPVACTVVFDTGPERIRRSVRLGIRAEATAVYRVRRPTTQRVRIAVDCEPEDD